MDVIRQENGERWMLYNGDSVEVLEGIPDNSIGYSIFSPPFASLYCYSNSERDLGNCRTDEEFYTHFGFIANHLFRVIQPGRLVSIHCMQIPAMKERDGYIGLKDFRGDIIRMFQKAGFIFHGEVTIWKDPLVEATRTKALGLMHKQLCKDSSMCRQGLPDYIVTMRKPGENKNLISHPDGLTVYAGEDKIKAGTFSHEVWRKYASPVWFDIRQTHTLNKAGSREEKDERHVCIAEGSLVLTKEHGYIPIETVSIGDNVLTHKGRWRNVLAVQKTGENKNVVQIKANGVPFLKTTPAHKVWAKDARMYKRESDYCKKVKPDWIEAHNLTGTYVNLKLPPTIEQGGDEILWWTIGRWIADGHIDQRNQPIISVGREKWDYFCSKIGRFGGNKPRELTAFQLQLKDPDFELRNIIKQCGSGAKNKQVPQCSLAMQPEKAKWLLDGYLSGDGHFLEDRNRWCMSSVSRQLLLGLSMIVQRVYGVCSSIYAGRPERKGEIQGRTVNMSQDWIMSFNLPDENGRISPKVFLDGAWKKVKSVEDSGASDTWNIMVEEDESYVAEGCIVKNCPLQLDVIERCLTLWSNKDDIVLSPFAGIGSEGYQAVKMGRKFIGIELKESYFNCAVKNIQSACKKEQQKELF